ncbi:hypothetical protein L0N31_26790, partial [Bacteroides thetaiotaomicron]|uniref:hypothetical protein n=1 Tax=Bacteroides thetaiotaomicron TaxID=818 RepID=UPI001D066D7E
IGINIIFPTTSVFDHSSFLKEENGVTIVYYYLVHSFAVFKNLMMGENNKLKNITMTIMLFL